MSGEGTPVIDNLEDALNCFYVGKQCCATLKAEIAALKSRVSTVENQLDGKLNTSEKPVIIQQSVAGAEALLSPEIAAASALAYAAKALADNAASIGRGAAALAGNAMSAAQGAASTAASAAGTAASALSKVLGLIGVVAALAATVATLLVLGARIDALESRIDSLDSELSKTLSTALQALGIGRSAQSTANTALGVGQQAQSTASTALANASHAQSTANSALTAAGSAQTTADRALTTAGAAQTTADRALTTAGSAQTTADRALTTAGAAQTTADRALTAAGSAQTTADRALTIAQQALARPGIQGRQGERGIAGAPGAVGAPGRAGVNGRDGAPGIAGAPGRAGANGRDGSVSPATQQRIDNLEQKINQQTSMDSSLLQTILQEVVGLRVTTSTGITAQQARDEQIRQQNITTQTQNITTQTQIRNLEPTIRQTIVGNPGATTQGIGAAIAAMPTTLANNPTFTGAIANAAAAGTCRTAQPGGCLGNRFDTLQNGQNNLINRLNLGLQAGQGALLAAINNTVNTVNSKLGAQVTGGLSGKLTRMSNWLQLDRVWNMLTYAAVLHNAWMLSSSFGQTLLSATSSFLAAVGITDEDGGAIDVGALIGKQIKEVAESIFGTGAVSQFETQYKKYMRVYQAAANIVSTLSSIGYSILSVLEIVGSRVSKIGNALRWFGVVSDRAYSSMNEVDNFQNPFFNRIIRMEEAASSIDTVSSEVVNVRQQSVDLKNQKKALDEAIKDLDKKADASEQKESAQIDKQTPDIKEEDAE